MKYLGETARAGGHDTMAAINDLAARGGPSTWRQALHLAERFFALVSVCEGFSGRFSSCIEALGRHIDEAAGRIARLG